MIYSKFSNIDYGTAYSAGDFVLDWPPDERLNFTIWDISIHEKFHQILPWTKKSSSSGQFFQLSFHNLKLFQSNLFWIDPNRELRKISENQILKNETSGMDYYWSTGLLSYLNFPLAADQFFGSLIPDHDFVGFQYKFKMILNKIMNHNLWLKVFIRQKICLALVQPVMNAKVMHVNGMRQQTDAALEHFQWHLLKQLWGRF